MTAGEVPLDSDVFGLGRCQTLHVLMANAFKLGCLDVDLSVSTPAVDPKQSPANGSDLLRAALCGPPACAIVK